MSNHLERLGFADVPPVEVENPLPPEEVPQLAEPEAPEVPAMPRRMKRNKTKSTDLAELNRRIREAPVKNRPVKKMVLSVTLNEYEAIVVLCEQYGRKPSAVLRRLVTLGLQSWTGFGPMDDGVFGMEPEVPGQRVFDTFRALPQTAREASFAPTYREAIEQEQRQRESEILRSIPGGMLPPSAR